MLKKINYIFSLEGIFDFSHSRFGTVKAKSDRNDMNGKRVCNGTCESSFFNSL
jgi:hypothetical protein